MSPHNISHEPVAPEVWRAFRAAHTRGTDLPGSVVAVVPFGAFLELAPGIHGLLHKQQWQDDGPQVGSTLAVRILEIDDEQQHLSLARA
jgi:small subunit ribosomal protein S1